MTQIDGIADFTVKPFSFPARYHASIELLNRRVRTFETTSVGRLFDTVAALVGFTREISFEGQAAMWLEHIAHGASGCGAYPFPFTDGELDWRPLLTGVVRNRLGGRSRAEIARAFHMALAQGLCRAALMLCEAYGIDTVVLSGGVFQNELLLACVKSLLQDTSVAIWTNSAVPTNDGGISLGQAALAAFHA